IIELANTCNLDCPMCRIGRYGFNNSRVMPIKLFRNIANHQFKKIELLRINGLGEASIVPQFEDYIDITDEFRCRKEIITNLTAEIDTYLHLLDSSYDLIISWDSANPKKYTHIRRGTNYEKQYKKLEYLASYSPHKIQLLPTLLPMNISDIKGVVQLAADFGIPKVILNVVKGYPWELGINRRMDLIKKELTSAAEIAILNNVTFLVPNNILGHNIDLPMGISTSTSSERCSRPFKECVIRFNGEVQVCNMFNPWIIGSLQWSNFKDIWNSRFAELFRKFVNTENKHPYCHNCVFIKNQDGV
ncbi:MAG: radical SAM/SPASM domain-containing protein, partial [Candidatus Helarchaeota archaeon]